MAERWQHQLRKIKTLEPPPGLWDRAMAGARREPPRARATWQVIAPIAAGLAVVLVAGTFGLVRAFGPASGGPGSSSSHNAGRFTDPVYGWSIRVPAGLRARHFRGGDVRVTADGVRVTNFVPDLSTPAGGAPPTGWLRYFPANGVAVQIWTLQGGLVGPPPLRDSRFPLSRASFSQARPYLGGTEPHPWYRDGFGDGIGFSTAVWIGPHASLRARHAAWAVVRSLRFPRLREGTIWHHNFYVLGPALRYPVGSITRFEVASLPRKLALSNHVHSGFYLIHAPRAFYVVNREFQRPVIPFSGCTLSYAPQRRQFYCPGTGLRWNLVGQPAGRGAYNLALSPATVAQDGHILFNPLWGDGLGGELRGSPWR